MEIEQREIIITIGALNLKGRLDSQSAPNLKQVWQYYETQGINNVVLNLQYVDFIDSAGITALVAGMKQLRARGGDLRLVGLQPSARAVFELMMLDKVFEIFETEEEALKGF
ncbi:MAG TPA: STAS domain-containing protein [Chloroflexia bacterium]|nr:STAS domain-containing protein [Chloroflexia bacterium]